MNSMDPIEIKITMILRRFQVEFPPTFVFNVSFLNFMTVRNYICRTKVNAR